MLGGTQVAVFEHVRTHAQEVDPTGKRRIVLLRLIALGRVLYEIAFPFNEIVESLIGSHELVPTRPVAIRLVPSLRHHGYALDGVLVFRLHELALLLEARTNLDGIITSPLVAHVDLHHGRGSVRRKGCSGQHEAAKQNSLQIHFSDVDPSGFIRADRSGSAPLTNYSLPEATIRSHTFLALG